MEAILIHKENNDLVDEINNSKFPTSNLRKLFELEARSREQIKLKTQKNRKLKLDDDDDDSNIEQGQYGEMENFEGSESDNEDYEEKRLEYEILNRPSSRLEEKDESDNEYQSVSKGIERLSIEIKSQKSNSSYTERRRKRGVWEQEKKQTNTFLKLKQYSLENFFIKK